MFALSAGSRVAILDTGWIGLKVATAAGEAIPQGRFPVPFQWWVATACAAHHAAVKGPGPHGPLKNDPAQDQGSSGHPLHTHRLSPSRNMLACCTNSS